MTFRRDPYSLQGFVFLDVAADAATPSPERVSPGPMEWAELPPNTKHAEALAGLVNFVPHPEAYDMPRAPLPKSLMSRIFIGQLPYNVTEMQVAWLVEALTGIAVFDVERIKKWTDEHQPKGCVHAYCAPELRDDVIAMLHRHVLVDDSGVWFAADAAQKAALEDYCALMKADKTRRFRDRPYQPLVVQAATSTFVPHQVGASRRAAAAMTPPPPPYGAWCEAPAAPPMMEWE